MTIFEEYDWRDLRRTGILHAYMIPPASLNDTLGELLGIDWAASSVSAGYYTDTRTSGQLVLSGSGDEYIPPAFVRIVYEIPDWHFKKEIGTYAVRQAPATRKNGHWRTVLELQSLLYTMDLDKAAKPLVLAPYSQALPAVQEVLKRARRDADFWHMNNKRILTAQVLESGQSQLSRMFALCEISDNRLDVDGHGVITVKPYESPASKSPIYTLDLSDPRGIVRDEVTRTSNLFELPSESVVIYKWSETADGKTEQRELSATAYISDDSLVDADVRGFNVTDLHSLTEMSPATTTQAHTLAQGYLRDNSHENIEWTLSTKFLPLWEGDVIELVVPDSFRYCGSHKCLVKNAEFSGPYMDLKLTLKELTGGE